MSTLQGELRNVIDEDKLFLKKKKPAEKYVQNVEKKYTAKLSFKCESEIDIFHQRA